MTNENLSEELFKPRFDFLETSVISNSGCPLPKLSRVDLAYGFEKDFYRPIHRFLWTLGGGNPLDIDLALSNICVSKNPRSRQECLDTVKEYGAGNWIYEFCTIAQRRVQIAHDAIEKGDFVQASHQYRMASRYFAIAAYPNLKGDSQASNADVLCRRYYKEMYKVDPNSLELREETFLVDNKKVTGYLHLPTNEKQLPCVICVCSYGNSIANYYRIYNDFFKPKNIAMFVIEMPGIGACEKLNLNDHYSAFVEKAIDHLASLPYVDAKRIALMGSDIGAASCLRACILQPNKVRAIILNRPYVHSIFSDKEYLDSMPLCLRSSFCNRLNLDASNWDILTPRFKIFSLKEQGILSNSNQCTVPTLLCAIKDSYVSNADLDLMKHNFRDLTVYTHDNVGYASFAKDAVFKIVSFLEEKLGI